MTEGQTPVFPAPNHSREGLKDSGVSLLSGRRRMRAFNFLFAFLQPVSDSNTTFLFCATRGALHI